MRRLQPWIWIILAVALMAVGVRWLYVETHRGMWLTKDGISARFQHLQGEHAEGESMKPQAPSSDIMPGSVVIDQPGPYYPDAVLTITVTYDQEARKGNRTPQYPYHPQFQAMYGQAGKGQIFMWIGDTDSATSVKNNHDGTFTAHGIPLLMNVTEHPGWDPTQPGTLDFGVYNIKEVNGQMIWTCYAWGEFVIEPVPA